MHHGRAFLGRGVEKVARSGLKSRRVLMGDQGGRSSDRADHPGASAAATVVAAAGSNGTHPIASAWAKASALTRPR